MISYLGKNCKLEYFLGNRLLLKGFFKKILISPVFFPVLLLQLDVR